MRGVCLNGWQPDGCEWTAPYLWRWMSWIVRLDVIVLALMFAGVAIVVIRISCRSYSARRRKEVDNASSRKLAAVLSIELGGLKAIASGAPYLGLAGTCAGLMTALVTSGGNTSLATVTAKMAAPLITTALGILVAVPATCSYNYLCTRKDLPEGEFANCLHEQVGLCRPASSKLRLTKRFSQLPAFALIAAPCLAALVAVDTPYFAPREPTGLELELAPSCPENHAHDRATLLHITDAGKLFLNEEQEDWNGLAGRLAEICRVRAQRTLDVVVDDGVPFQTVADALDITENVPVSAGTQGPDLRMEKLDIRVRLLTPNALNAHCPESVVGGSIKRALR